MTTLKQIKGSAIQFLDEDPVVYAGTWSSGGNVNTARAYGGSSGTSRDAAMYFGGYTTPTNYANTEQYNGTSWTEVNDLSNSRTGLAGFGNSLTSAVAFGGDEFPAPSPRYLADVEEWNGTNWTSGTNLPAATQQQNGAGTLTAGLAIGGDQPSSPNLTQTLEYDGTNWTSGGNLNTGKQFARVSCGLQTAALIAGAPGYSATTEQYNGTAWTEVNDLNTAGAQGGGGGTYTSAITSGNQNTASSNAESWDGTSWTETNNRSTDNYALGGSGSSNQNGVVHHGYDSSPAGFPTATEEWAFPAITETTLNEGDMWFNSSTSTLKGYGTAAGLPAATWASGGNLNVAKSSAAGAGTQTAGIFMGGRGSPPSNTVYAQTELYNGSTWTEVNDMNTGRYSLSGANSGSQTATLAFGGYDTAILAVTESWDGTNWTEVNDLNTAGSSGSGFGTQTAAIFTGGDNRSYNKTESWNGTSWTETTDLNTARAQMAGFGIATAGLICGGDLYPVTSPTRLAVQTELWDGSSWTETGDLNTGRRRIGNGGFGTQTSGLTAGGYTTTYVANTETWNGTSWTERTEIQTRDNTTGVGGGGPLGFIAGGGTSPGAASNATEEWTAPAVVSTVTTS